MSLSSPSNRHPITPSLPFPPFTSRLTHIHTLTMELPYPSSRAAVCWIKVAKALQVLAPSCARWKTTSMLSNRTGYSRLGTEEDVKDEGGGGVEGEEDEEDEAREGEEDGDAEEEEEEEGVVDVVVIGELSSMADARRSREEQREEDEVLARAGVVDVARCLSLD